jgi:hypothetical protein
MSTQEKFEVAKQYIDKQIATMREHGCAPTSLTEREYQAMVKQTAKTILR